MDINLQQNQQNNGLPELEPFDEYNQRLRQHVRPGDWVNPKPASRYHLVVIGAGTAGLVAAAGAAALGARVALVERRLMGGDCLNVGCIPSKALIASARIANTLREAPEYGIRLQGNLSVDFAAVMQRMRRLRASIAPHDSASRFRDLGVDVFFGQAHFTSHNTIEVGGEQLRFARCIIATGSSPARPDLQGLDTIDYLTNESVFSLTELPGRLAIIGGGPIGCELAQTFALFGSQVALLHSDSGLLPREVPHASAIVRRSLQTAGVEIVGGGRHVRIAKSEEGIELRIPSNQQMLLKTVDRLLVAVGRTPNVDSLNLTAAGIDRDEHGVVVDDYLRTSNRRVYAAGDVCSRYKFTHAADFMARLAVQNCLFLRTKKFKSLVIPWCTYTSPEVASVGLNPHAAADAGMEIDTFVQPLEKNDRGVVSGEDEGFAEIYVRKGSGQIVGATIVALNAGDLISEVTLAMTHGLKLGDLASTVHPYPTLSEVWRQLGDQYNRTRLTSLARSVTKRWIRWTR